MEIKRENIKVLNEFRNFVQEETNCYWDLDYENLGLKELNSIIIKLHSELPQFIENVWEKFYYRLTEERVDYAISIPTKDQREYFINFYNFYVSTVVKGMRKYLKDLSHDLLRYSHLMGRGKTLTLEKHDENIKEFLKLEYLALDKWQETFKATDIPYHMGNNDLNTSSINFIKLQWKGQKNQLYNVLRQLKILGLIGNSYNSLAEFLMQNVTGFDEANVETIETEFKRNKELPKPKRIKLEPGEAE